MAHDGHMTSTQDTATATLSTRDIADNTLYAGGITISIMDLTQPSDGYMVALAGHEMIVESLEFGASIVYGYIISHWEALAAPDAHLGTWLDKGKVYLDVSVRICDRAEAIAFGRANAQLAIYDVASGESIDL